MLKAINKILGLLLFTVLVATCFYIFMPYEINDPELLRLTDKLQSLWPSVVLSLGALTAWIALQINRRYQEEESIRKESSFFFDECKERFVSILDIIDDSKSNTHTELSYIATPLLRNQLENISHHVSDISILNKSIICAPFKNAYERDFDNVKRKVEYLFEKANFYNLSGFSYGENKKDIHVRIAEFNTAIADSFKRDNDVEDMERHRRGYMQKRPGVPFSNGISFESINVILQFFFDTDIDGFQNKALHEYVKMCNDYSNVDGILVRKE